MEVIVPTREHGSYRVRRRASGTLLWWLLALLGSAVCAFGTVQPWSIFAFEVGAIALGIAAAAKWAFRGREFAAPATLAPMLLFVVLCLVQLALHRTVSGYDTRYQLLLWVAYISLCIVAANAATVELNLMRMGVAISIFGTALALFAVVQSLAGNGKLYWLVTPQFSGAMFGPYVDHSHFAGLMEMLAPFPFLLAGLRWMHGGRRALLVTAGLIMLGSIVASGSRGALVVIAAQTLFAFVFDSTRSAKRRLAMAAIFVVLAVGASAAFTASGIVERLRESVARPRSDLSFATRATVLKDSTRMFPVHPILGWGLGTFAQAFPQYRSEYDGTTMNAAHNDYLQFLIETGSVGLLLFLWLLWRVYRSGQRCVREWSESPARAVCFAALIGVTGIVVHSCFDFNLQIPANAAVFFVLCTVAAGFRNVRSQTTSFSYNPVVSGD